MQTAAYIYVQSLHISERAAVCYFTLCLALCNHEENQAFVAIYMQYRQILYCVYVRYSTCAHTHTVNSCTVL